MAGNPKLPLPAGGHARPESRPSPATGIGSSGLFLFGQVSHCFQRLELALDLRQRDAGFLRNQFQAGERAAGRKVRMSLDYAVGRKCMRAHLRHVAVGNHRAEDVKPGGFCVKQLRLSRLCGAACHDQPFGALPFGHR